MKQDFVILPREVAEQALKALQYVRGQLGSTVSEFNAIEAIRAALDQPQAEQDPTPNGATHIQLQQGAFYKRVDGKWYVWSLMKNGEPRRWYISPGTAESCLEPLYTHPQPKREPLTDDELDKLCPQFEDPMRREMWKLGFKVAHNIKD